MQPLELLEELSERERGWGCVVVSGTAVLVLKESYFLLVHIFVICSKGVV